MRDMDRDAEAALGRGDRRPSTTRRALAGGFKRVWGMLTSSPSKAIFGLTILIGAFVKGGSPWTMGFEVVGGLLLMLEALPGDGADDSTRVRS
jgi:hypothetical protein